MLNLYRKTLDSLDRFEAWANSFDPVNVFAVVCVVFTLFAGSAIYVGSLL